jgi:hypothetical protein
MVWRDRGPTPLQECRRIAVRDAESHENFAMNTDHLDPAGQTKVDSATFITFPASRSVVIAGRPVPIETTPVRASLSDSVRILW